MNDRELIQSGYRYALSLAHSEADAEDLVQAAFAKLYARPERSTDRPLLFTTIRTLFFDNYRRGKIVAFHSLDEAAAPEPPSTDEALGTRKDLAHFLAKLRPEEREALFLHAVEGYTAAEIAAMTQRPRNTVLSLIHRARTRLSEAVEKERIATAEPGKGGRG